jgi:hypothetical protein
MRSGYPSTEHFRRSGEQGSPEGYARPNAAVTLLIITEKQEAQMDKARMRKAAWLSAAGTLAVATATVAAPVAAHAGVTYSCGNDVNPTKAIDPYTRETHAHVLYGAFGYYPAFYLRSGVYDGSGLLWAKASFARDGIIDMDFYKSFNNNTHYKCSATTSFYDAATYTPGVTYGWHNAAFDFRPCEMIRSPLSGTDEWQSTPWVCAAWISG